MTFTHVDTCKCISPFRRIVLFELCTLRTATGVLSDPQKISETVKKVSPESLVILDGVCSVASEEIRFDEWSIDGMLFAK